ncbi:UvrD-helicase domain-containing protein [Prevotella copri]|uniref:DNA 3'-5' helicase n=1 Tax=Segatella copri TaxID=165179 RepID=A0AAW5III5_9BACT|nr:UvrD-helicase domain-containing protein [Segatella copri]MCP9534383.1 UvrD-helicase domain-containing protein [Segatella copri]MCP9537320.1 UvrD-helicase domain-containing protein [Segatella copri]MCP9540328.1 UvrD-helicase domain-containing protein [Segatella copri]MCP9558622.1 UvrD-helicase domain-containing protein [Segatella copri]MCP9561427.1 UvrD-helicase domain-containing protein [Segatella copri]
MDLLNDLNDAQRAAVEYIDGPSLVIAGAGSGKTRVLTYKIAYLLSQGMKPWSIMALTFTNKAAREMKERIGKLVGDDLAQHLYMGTFHSIFSRILRAEAEHIGFNNNFTIYDESDSRSLLKAIIKEMGLDDKTYKPAAVHARISMAKNNLVTAEAYDSDPAILEQNKRAKMPAIGKIYVAYVQRCRQANAMDFDDLLMLTFQLFRDHEEIRQKYAGRFDYILVDEYQDTNHVQMSIVMQLCKEKLRVCAVGDDSQSIYSFRGANIDNILNYQKQLPGTQLFKLEQNYRSTQTIVEAANSLIHHNRNQIQKEVFSKNDKGEKILYKPAYSDKEEALIVAKNIQRIKRQDDCGYDQFAILYRTNAQSRSFEEEFRKQGIPYRIYGGLSFYQRKEIKDIIAYFRLVANPDDEEAFKRIINYPARGIGATTVMKIADCAHQNQVSFWEVIGNVEHYGLNVNKGTQTKLENFRLLISSFIDRSHTLDVYELGDAIIRESRISEDIMSGKNADDLARQENLEEFLSGMQTFVAGRQEEGRMDEAYLTDYLQDVALLTDADSEGEKDEPRVSLMTIHAAKGLEFATVFVVGLEENIFPSPLAAVSVRELEEERRLLYVAITRAEKHCILTNAKNRFRYGKMEFDNPSRFIDEIDASLIEGGEETPESSFGGGYGGRMPWDRDRSGYRRDYQNAKPVASQFMADPKPGFKSVRAVNAAHRIMGDTASSSSVALAGSSASKASSAAGSLSEGCRIEHQRFGIGRVLKIEGTGENTKATVEFQNAGTKQLLLKFAKFTILS